MNQIATQNSQPGDLFNKFQKKKKKMTMKMPAMKAGKSAMAKPFVPTYGGKVGGKMSNGAGWGGEPKMKGKKKSDKKKKKAIAKSGSFKGKSNKLGQGGRAAQLKAKGVPGGVIGNLARAAKAAPGMKNFHKKGKKHKFIKKNDHDADDKKKKTMCKMCGK